MAGWHRADAPTWQQVLTEVRAKMSATEILEAAQALTVGDAAYHRKFEVAGRPVRLENRGPDARMGRFGGGWDFEIGIQMGRSGTKGTIIVNLGKGSIRIDPRKKG